VVIIEVLSPSSEGDDEGDKRHDFQTLASLRAYVVAAQDERRVRVWCRDAGGAWRDVPDTFRDGESFALPTLSRPIAVAEVYDGVLDAGGRSLLH
jgi:Uma2 family endonuclease